MKIELLRREKPVGFPSASALEYRNGTLYALGDDSLRLYCWKNGQERLNDILIDPNNAEPSGERIPKKSKPDFEMLTVVGNRLMGMGSCSKGPERETAFFFDGNTFEFFSVTQFRAAVEGVVMAAGAKKTNFEGLAARGDVLYVFHRGGANGESYVFTVAAEELKTGGTMRIAAVPLLFDSTERGKPGVTGATQLRDDVFLLTAAVEITDDPVHDGEVTESFLCLWRAGESRPYELLPLTAALHSDSPPKIESVAWFGDDRIVLCADDDAGGSELFFCRLET